jgi:hypothetical protein
MKPHCHLPAALAALFLLTLSANAQEDRPAPPRDAERPAAHDGALAERVRNRIRELHAEGKHEEANHLAKRIRNARMDHAKHPERPMPPQAERKGPPHPVAPPPVMKVRNLIQAAGLLDAAGYREYAEKARAEAGRLEGEMKRAEEARKREAEQKKMEEGKRRDAEAKKEGEMKHRAEEKLRADEVRGMREEMHKLRREVEELRGQLRKAKAEAEKGDEPQRREES